MSETRELIRFTAITDFEVPMYHMGEVDFQYSTEVLTDHCERYGADELLNMLGFMQHIVWEIKLSQSKADMANSAQADTHQDKV